MIRRQVCARSVGSVLESRRAAATPEESRFGRRSVKSEFDVLMSSVSRSSGVICQYQPESGKSNIGSPSPPGLLLASSLGLPTSAASALT